MKLSMTWISNEAPRIAFESETEGDYLILKSMSELDGFRVLAFDETGPFLSSCSPLSGNKRHGILKLLPEYKPQKMQ